MSRRPVADFTHAATPLRAHNARITSLSIDGLTCSSDVTVFGAVRTNDISSVYGDILINNEDTTSDIKVKLGADTTTPQFKVQNDSDTNLFIVDGTGNASILGVLLTPTIISDNITVSARLRVNDNKTIDFGTSSNKLTITHDGNSKITSNNGNLIINNTNASGHTYIDLGASNLIPEFAVRNSSGGNIFTASATGKVTSSSPFCVGGDPDDDHIFQAKSTTQGSSPAPSMTTAQKNAIVTPIGGMQVYDTVLKRLEWYTGTAWKAMAPLQYQGFYENVFTPGGGGWLQAPSTDRGAIKYWHVAEPITLEGATVWFDSTIMSGWTGGTCDIVFYSTTISGTSAGTVLHTETIAYDDPVTANNGKLADNTTNEVNAYHYVTAVDLGDTIPANDALSIYLDATSATGSVSNHDIAVYIRYR